MNKINIVYFILNKIFIYERILYLNKYEMNTFVEEFDSRLVVVSYRPEDGIAIRNLLRLLRVNTSSPEEIKRYIYRLQQLYVAYNSSLSTGESNNIDSKDIDRYKRIITNDIKSEVTDKDFKVIVDNNGKYGIVTEEDAINKIVDKINNKEIIDGFTIVYVKPYVISSTERGTEIIAQEFKYIDTFLGRYINSKKKYKTNRLFSITNFVMCVFADEDFASTLMEIVHNESIWERKNRSSFTIDIKVVERVRVARDVLIEKTKSSGVEF